MKRESYNLLLLRLVCISTNNIAIGLVRVRKIRFQPIKIRFYPISPKRFLTFTLPSVPRPYIVGFQIVSGPEYVFLCRTATSFVSYNVLSPVTSKEIVFKENFGNETY
jgi:hypothetical protein